MKKILTLILAGSLVLSACSKSSNESQKSFHHQNGYIEARLVYLSSSNSGRLVKRTVNRGAKVKANELLFAIDPNPQVFDIKQATANLNAAKHDLEDMLTGKRPAYLHSIDSEIKSTQAELEYSKRQLARYEDLIGGKYIQQDKLDQAIEDVKVNTNEIEKLQAELNQLKLPARPKQIESAESDVHAAQMSLEKAKWQLQQKTVKSPASGMVFDTYYRVGEQVPARQPVLSLLVPDDVKAIFFVPEPQLSQIKLNQEITVNCDGCKKPVPAFISFISPDAEYTPPVIYSRKSQSKLVYRVEARFKLAQAYQLHSGQPIRVMY